MRAAFSRSSLIVVFAVLACLVTTGAAVADPCPKPGHRRPTARERAATLNCDGARPASLVEPTPRDPLPPVQADAPVVETPGAPGKPELIGVGDDNAASVVIDPR